MHSKVSIDSIMTDFSTESMLIEQRFILWANPKNCIFELELASQMEFDEKTEILFALTRAHVSPLVNFNFHRISLSDFFFNETFYFDAQFICCYALTLVWVCKKYSQKKKSSSISILKFWVEQFLSQFFSLSYKMPTALNSFENKSFGKHWSFCVRRASF